MGARRAEATEAMMAELLAALVAHPGEWFTTNDAAALTTTGCRSGTHDPENRWYDEDASACWTCHGTMRRQRMGWEVRRHLMHLLSDGLVRIIPGRPAGGMHQWQADTEAVALEALWADLADGAPATVHP